MKRIISTPLAPAAVGPYSQAVEVNGTLYISGQIPLVPQTGKLIEGDIQAQTGQVFKNIEAILTAAGYEFSDVVKCTVLLANMDDFAAMNAVYASVYTRDMPARAAYQVAKLPLGSLVEIETIAVKSL